MKHLITLYLLLILSTTTWSQDTWVKVIGGSGDDRGCSVTTTSDRGVLVTGITRSNDRDFKGMNKGWGDVFVIKLDKDGGVMWKKTFGGRDHEEGNSVTTTSDGDVLVTGTTLSNDGDFEGMSTGWLDIFVIKLDKDGEVLWKKTFGGTNSDLGHSFTTTSSDEILITGETSSNDGDFKGLNEGKKDIFVIKLDKDGSILWKKTFGGDIYDEGTSITTTLDDGVLITGKTRFKDVNNKYSDVFIIKLDKDGEVLWKKTFGGKGLDIGNSITTTSDGGILITGETDSNDGDFGGNKGNDDIFIIKLDKDGGVLWKKTYGGLDYDSGVSITTTSDDGILITGGTCSNDGDFKGMYKGNNETVVMSHSYDYLFKKRGYDTFIMKLNNDGGVMWKKTFGGTLTDRGTQIKPSEDGIVLTGYTTSNNGDFKGLNKGGEEIFIMKLDNDGNLKSKGKKSKKK